LLRIDRRHHTSAASQLDGAGLTSAAVIVDAPAEQDRIAPAQVLAT
jgi:hypothetical protein